MACSSCKRSVRIQSKTLGLCAACYAMCRKWSLSKNTQCEHCGKGYYSGKVLAHSLCSRACFKAWTAGRDQYNQKIVDSIVPELDGDAKIVLACQHCCGQFKVFPYELKRSQRYCSMRCNGARRLHERANRICEWCKEIFTCLPNRIGRLTPARFCSAVCARNAKSAKKLERESKRGIRYEELMPQVLLEQVSCRGCGTQGQLLEHHKIRTMERIDLMMNKDNLEVLCRSCHTLEHADQGHYQITVA